MIIAVNTRVISGDTASAAMLKKVFTDLAATHASLQINFIAAEEECGFENTSIRQHVISQQKNNPLFWKLWYNYRLPALLRKMKADVLVSADGVCSLRSKLPQLVVLNDLQWKNHPGWYSPAYLRFIKSNNNAFLQKAAAVMVPVNALKEELMKQGKIAAEKIHVISPVPPAVLQPLNWEQRESVKEKYSGGNEYFLFKGAIHEKSRLTNLLKAFSLFKKRLKSNMQLVLLTDVVNEKNPFVDSLRLYKYRQDVKLLQQLPAEEADNITAAAWALVQLSPLVGDIACLQEYTAAVPAMTVNTAAAKELLGNAAIYVDAASVDEIAAGLMLLYKDESARTALLSQAATRAADYNWLQYQQTILQLLKAARTQ